MAPLWTTPTRWWLDMIEEDLKKIIFERLLRLGTIKVSFVKSHSDVKLPKIPLKSKPMGEVEVITFDYGLNLTRPIPDLEISAAGVSGTLAFNYESFHTFVPWEAVVAMVVTDTFMVHWAISGLKFTPICPKKTDGKNHLKLVK